jgi:hypothetical protein
MSGRLATVVLTIVLGLTLTACSPGPSPSPTPQIYSGFTPLPYPLSTANDYLGNIIDMGNGYVGGATKCLVNSGQPTQPSVLTGTYDYTYNTNNSGQILANVYNIVNVNLSAQDIKQIVVHATNPKTSMLTDPKQNYSYNCAEYVPSKNNSLYYIVGLLSADTVTYQVATNGTVSGSAGTIGSTPSGPASTPPASTPQQTNGTCPATGASVG